MADPAGHAARDEAARRGVIVGSDCDRTESGAIADLDRDIEERARRLCRSAEPHTGGSPGAGMECPPCARGEHDACQISHMGMLQAFCQCECREDGTPCADHFVEARRQLTTEWGYVSV